MDSAVAVTNSAAWSCSVLLISSEVGSREEKKNEKVPGSAKQQGILQRREDISHLSVSAAETFPASVRVQRN